MGFNTLEFLIFLLLIFILYWRWKDSIRVQNLILLLGSYIFYMWWDWRFLFLIILSSTVDYYVGKSIPLNNRKYAKLLLWTSITVNIGLLAVFKYYNFFISSFSLVLSSIGLSPNLRTLSIILPVGISFYTFQTLSYTIDIYRKRLKPTNDMLAFYTFVSFFPQLVAGPIERATRFLPQFKVKRKFSYEQSVEGLRFFLYGMFKKVVIADSLGVYVDEIFGNYESLGGFDLFLGVYFFYAIQLYCDFSGYSDMAIGSARLLGFNLSRNFAYPFYSRNFGELWQRWHITLSNWFRDYVLIQMLRSRWKVLGAGPLALIMFALIGLWHGPNYTFVIWGLLNGAVYVIQTWLIKKGYQNPVIDEVSLKDWKNIFVTNFLVGLFLVFFRSPSVGFSLDYISHMFSPSFFTKSYYWPYIFWPVVLFFWEWNHRDHWHGLKLDHWKKWQRRMLYVVMTILIMYNFGNIREFIYYQF